MSGQSLARPGVFCHDRMFLCRDKVRNGEEALCHDIIFYVAIECAQMEKFCVATGNFMLGQSWPRQGEIMLR